ncbi:hypothetical protein EMIHUDRAFT_458082 [Emiliania huxleyi CCMP1516]|uniref:Uncharacterized protein n=2 Tax=Emiliania huxleyi TaxID=2903 RepID=A0A0D3JID3_EMIH1|nr:hypothetical protein EMIHUDRAFT_458082 [Emiliania huxleyi CCMP1516]EOD23268.1 hypothetical protein EMIHUDRAFT_458082 [Emiliania huxleyi CCMP1516]|eukprot:XP_005775697.1 hypothetical protein EMIHUDRAFT_458082 [Emiliania huxleyi CCMP1516]
MSQPGKVDLSMFEGPPPAAPRYRSAQPAVQQNPFAPAQPAAQPNPAAPIADNPFAPAAPAAPVDNPFFGGPSDDAAGGSDSLLGALDPDAAQPEESLTTQIAPGEKEEDEDKTLDTFHYLAQLGEGSRDEKLAAARALFIARDIINLGIKKLQKRLAKGGGGGKVPTSSLKRLSLSRGTSRKFDSSSYNTGAPDAAAGERGRSSTHSDGANPPSYGGGAFGGGGAEEVSPAPHFQKRKSGLFRKR